VSIALNANNVELMSTTLEWIYLSNIIIIKIKKMTPKNYNEFSSHFFGLSFLFFHDNFDLLSSNLFFLDRNIIV
jgi:hypothetical protein